MCPCVLSSSRGRKTSDADTGKTDGCVGAGTPSLRPVQEQPESHLSSASTPTRVDFQQRRELRVFGKEGHTPTERRTDHLERRQLDWTLQEELQGAGSTALSSKERTAKIWN